MIGRKVKAIPAIGRTYIRSSTPSIELLKKRFSAYL
jgi:hypothetical protein